jgi:hypothetical protein
VVGGLLRGDVEFDHVQVEVLLRGQAVQFLGAGGVAGAGGAHRGVDAVAGPGERPRGQVAGAGTGDEDG